MKIILCSFALTIIFLLSPNLTTAHDILPIEVVDFIEANPKASENVFY